MGSFAVKYAACINEPKESDHMDSLLLTFGSVRIEWQTTILSFLTAFILSSVISVTYEKTFRGLSFSRNLMQAMVLGSLISCLLMIAIGDNVARGIGIVGSLAVIRFRTNLRDPRDLVFLFGALGTGVAAGVQSYVTAVIATIVFCTSAFLLNMPSFGMRRDHDGLVRFQIPAGHDAADLTAKTLRRFARTYILVTMRNVAQGEYVDCAYQVKLKKEEDSSELIKALEAVEGIRGLTYMNQQTTVEV
jgi:uncharacterized membrane protein YhiD involved in acid resistance